MLIPETTAGLKTWPLETSNHEATCRQPWGFSFLLRSFSFFSPFVSFPSIPFPSLPFHSLPCLLFSSLFFSSLLLQASLSFSEDLLAAKSYVGERRKFKNLIRSFLLWFCINDLWIKTKKTRKLACYHYTGSADNKRLFTTYKLLAKLFLINSLTGKQTIK